MEVTSISKKLYHSLEKIELDKKIYNTEGELFIIPQKDKWNMNNKVLKKLYNDKGAIFGNKLLTVNALIDNRDKINIEEMVLPEKLAVYNNKIVGFTMPYIKNINLEEILNDSKCDVEFKRKLLQEAGTILEKMKTLRDYNVVEDFYLGDVHEGNFIYNTETNKLNVVDVDSCSIAHNKPFASKYLTEKSICHNYPNKYIVNNDRMYSGYIIPNENSDIYCYNIMVLNHLYGDKVNTFSEDKFFLYLDYLRSIGYSYDELDAFMKLCEPTDNILVSHYLEEMPKDYKTVTLSKKLCFEKKIGQR